MNISSGTRELNRVEPLWCPSFRSISGYVDTSSWRQKWQIQCDTEHGTSLWCVSLVWLREPWLVGACYLEMYRAVWRQDLPSPMAYPASFKTRLCSKTKLWSEPGFINQERPLGCKEKWLTFLCFPCFLLTLCKNCMCWWYSHPVSEDLWLRELTGLVHSHRDGSQESQIWNLGFLTSNFMGFFQLPKYVCPKTKVMQPHYYWSHGPLGTPMPWPYIILSFQSLLRNTQEHVTM